MITPSGTKSFYVIMPFSEKENPCGITRKPKYWDGFYKSFLEQTIHNLGHTCSRSEALAGNILEHLFFNLLDSDYVIAVITDEYANVFYELATRHALRPGTIVILEDGQKVPFDLGPLPVLFYEDTAAGRDTFEKKLKHTINKLEQSNEIIDGHVAKYIQENPYKIINHTGITKIVKHGLRTVKLPDDNIPNGDPIRILMFGIDIQYFSDDLKKLIKNRETRVELLLNFDENACTTRALAQRRTAGNYIRRITQCTKEFLENVRPRETTTVKLCKDYPFGIFVQLNNYIWFTPMWNDYSEGSAVQKSVIEIRRDSCFGNLLETNYNVLWDRNQAYQFDDFLKLLKELGNKYPD